jgi:hypothetical protein
MLGTQKKSPPFPAGLNGFRTQDKPIQDGACINTGGANAGNWGEVGRVADREEESDKNRVDASAGLDSVTHD